MGTVGVGVIGCGNVAVRAHLPAYLQRRDRVRVVAVADPSPDRLDEARQLTGLPANRAFADYAALLALRDVDYIDICAPPRFHLAIAAAAAAAGKHILCEKPAATMPAEAEAIRDVAARADVTLGFVHNYLCFPELVAARRIVDSGEIGEVRMGLVNYLGVPDLPGVDGAGASWRHNPASSGGGVLMDMLHVVYVAEFLIRRRAERVAAFVSGNDSHPEVEALALCRLETDGPPVLVNVGWGAGPGGFVIEGTRGSVEVRYRDGGTSPFAPFESMAVRTAEGSRLERLTRASELQTLGIESVGAIIDDFLDALATGHPPLATGDDALHAVEVTVAAYESAALGRTVAVPLGRDDPLYLRGVAGVHELAMPAWTPIQRQGLYRARP